MAERIRKAKRLILFLDFDGTLVGFKRNPEEVRLGERTRVLLQGLALHPRMTLVFISGRRRPDLIRRVGVGGARYVGLHGFQTRDGMRVSAASRRALLRVRKLIVDGIKDLAGIWLEDKQASLALHTRGATAASAAKARAVARRALKSNDARLGILRGKKILELLAPEVKGKGAAACEWVGELGRGVLAVYFGDDDTDESAFAALRGAVTVHVGSGSRTLARYRVRNPREVALFLERLAALTDQKA